MSPRQARRERREAERKAKKLELKKSRQSGHLPDTLGPLSLAPNVAETDPRIQPRWNPELEDEFPAKNSCHDAAREAGRDGIPSRPRQLATFPTETRQNLVADRLRLKAGLPIPPSGPSPSFEDLRAKLMARTTPPPTPLPALLEEDGFVSQPGHSDLDHVNGDQTDTRRAAANRAAVNKANAQLSTGPRSPEGKLASSRNSTKHGLAAGTLLLPGEDPSAFEALQNDLLAEHQPATPTEQLLVEEMAQAYWLTQRALRLQNTCFTAEGVNEKQLALFLRYGTTYQNRFYKALNCLLQLKKQAARNTPGFVSQPTHPEPSNAGFVSQTTAATPVTPGFVSQIADDPLAEAV